MSRRIDPKASVTISEEEAALKRTDIGKLLLTSYQNRNCALLLRNDRLVAASFFPRESSKVGAIYIGKVKNMAKNIDACFVEIAKGEICFLPLKDATTPCLLNRKYDGRMVEGDELLVQVARDAQKSKRASVTAHISLANDYFSLSIGSTKVGYSSKLNKERKKAIKRLFIEHAILDPANNCCLIQGCDTLLSIREAEKLQAEGFVLETLRLPPIGFVVRTRAEEAESGGELLKQFFDISAQFVRILYIAMYRSCFSCLREPETGVESVLKQFISEYVIADNQALSEVVTDQESMYDQVKQYCERHKIQMEVRLYQDSLLSLSSLYSIQAKLENALGSRVWLKSGGYLIIEPTEALTVIDVNSGKYETDKDSRDTYRMINLEAAEEVAVQLRLRNLSGIILVDFINMQSCEDNEQLINYLRALVKQDKIKTTVVDMTRLGLVEITRKKINKPLKEQYLDVCRKES